jgi:Flp pilus assembly protein TadG
MLRRRATSLARFTRDRGAASAVEFALVAMPFFWILLCVFQMGIYYMTQSSLDSGVIRTGDTLLNTFYSGVTPTIPTAAALKTQVVANSGGLIHNDSTLSVELKQFSSLGATVLPVGNTVDPSVPGNVLALRATSAVTSFVPGFGSLSVSSSVLVRRQGL